MAKRGIRVMLWVVIVLIAAIAAYSFWQDQSAIRRDTAAARAFDHAANAAGRALMDLRAAQQAYVATGQGGDFWSAKVSSSLSAAQQALGLMRAARSEAAQGAILSASSTLDDFAQMDRRAREYVASGQLLMASDVIFSGGLELTESAWNDVQRARDGEQQASETVLRTRRQRQWIALGGAAAGAVLLALLLVPVPRPDVQTAVMPAAPPALELIREEPLDLHAVFDADDLRPKATRRKAPAPQPASVIAPAPSDVDLTGMAALCADLARVTDTRALPPILARASSLLDAAGIVLWIADPDGRELAPILAHGYSPQLVTRLGTIARDAENVTAAAFRTGVLQTVKADTVSNGAIAAPLVAPAGCVGVMAAEVRNGGEQKDARLAAATIVAAQLATLVGPPAARKAEAAGS
jgi:hypothetical protein